MCVSVSVCVCVCVCGFLAYRPERTASPKRSAGGRELMLGTAI